tara:strand:+ start:104 stop:253 length:150 start_codon:yes stop_codon:yes gene_type:complete
MSAAASSCCSAKLIFRFFMGDVGGALLPEVELKVIERSRAAIFQEGVSS